MSKAKITKKQMLANMALEKRKVKRRLSKSLSSDDITMDLINDKITQSHVDRLQNMLPPGIRTSSTNQWKPMPKKRRQSASSQIPYKPLKKNVLWLPLKQQDSKVTVPLTRELEKFADYVSLDVAEQDSRENMLRELYETILSKWPEADIHQFGSYAVGLSTFLSDLDISVLNMGVDNTSEEGEESLEKAPIPSSNSNKSSNHIISTVVLDRLSSLAALKASTSAPATAVVDLTESNGIISRKKSKTATDSNRSRVTSDDIDLTAETERPDDDHLHSKYNIKSSHKVKGVKAAAPPNVEEEVITWCIDTTGDAPSAATTDTSPTPAATKQGTKRKAEEVLAAAEEEEEGSEEVFDPDHLPSDSESGEEQEDSDANSEGGEDSHSYSDSCSDSGDSGAEDGEWLLPGSTDKHMEGTHGKKRQRDNSDSDSDSEEDSDSANSDSDVEVDLEAINRIYAQEERALVDIDDHMDNNDHDSFSIGQRELREFGTFEGVDSDGEPEVSDDEGEDDIYGEELEDEEFFNQAISGIASAGQASNDNSKDCSKSGEDVFKLKSSSTSNSTLAAGGSLSLAAATLLQQQAAGADEDDDEYYSDGDVYNIHRQNALFQSIKSRITEDLSVSFLNPDNEFTTVDSNGVTVPAAKDVGGEESGASDNEDEKSGAGEASSSGENEEENEEEDQSMDFTNSFSLNTSRGGSGDARADKEAELRKHKKVLTLLRGIFPHFKSMGWVNKLELRSKARVPIINLQHKNHIECDISIGVSAQDTSHIVAALKEFCGPALHILSAFLKIFLSQLELDKPFTGGLGSYKLYVMVAYHIQQNPNMVSDRERPNLGLLLLTFLKHFGNPRNLNCGTTLQVQSAEVSFDRTNQVVELQRTFEKAGTILYKVCRERVQQQNAVHSTEQSEDEQQGESGDEDAQVGKSKNKPLIIGSSTNGQNSSSSAIVKKDGHQFSSSALGLLLDTEELAKTRAFHRNKCREYPKLLSADCDKMAQHIINDLERRMDFHKGGASLEEIKTVNPCLYARLRSFSSVEQAVRHLGGRNSSFAPVTQPTGPYQRARRVVEPSSNIPANATQSGGGGSRAHHRSAGPGEYKFNFNGVGSNSIVNLPGATNKLVNRNKSSNSSNAFPHNTQQQTRHSFGGFETAGRSNGEGDKKRRRDNDSFNSSVISGFESGRKKQKPWVEDKQHDQQRVETPGKRNNKSNQSNNKAAASSFKQQQQGQQQRRQSGGGHQHQEKKSFSGVSPIDGMKQLSRRIGESVAELKHKLEAKQHSQKSQQQQTKNKKPRKFY